MKKYLLVFFFSVPLYPLSIIATDTTHTAIESQLQEARDLLQQSKREGALEKKYQVVQKLTADYQHIISTVDNLSAEAKNLRFRLTEAIKREETMKSSLDQAILSYKDSPEFHAIVKAYQLIRPHKEDPKAKDLWKMIEVEALKYGITDALLSDSSSISGTVVPTAIAEPASSTGATTSTASEQKENRTAKESANTIVDALIQKNDPALTKVIDSMGKEKLIELLEKALQGSALK